MKIFRYSLGRFAIFRFQYLAPGKTANRGNNLSGGVETEKGQWVKPITGSSYQLAAICRVGNEPADNLSTILRVYDYS